MGGVEFSNLVNRMENQNLLCCFRCIRERAIDVLKIKKYEVCNNNRFIWSFCNGKCNRYVS